VSTAVSRIIDFLLGFEELRNRAVAKIVVVLLNCNMPAANRRFVYSVLIVFLVNTFAWTVSSPALADWLAHSQEAAASVNTARNPDPGTTDSGRINKDCDHGCHAAQHLQGQTSRAFTMFLNEPRGAICIPETHPPIRSFPDTPYRPPRFSLPA